MKNLETISQVNGPHLVVQELSDELVIFDRTTNKAHMLDSYASQVWRASAGGTTVDRLVSHFGEGSTDSDRSLVRLAIMELERAGLLLGGEGGSALSRRGLLKTLSVSTAAPLVISILTPTSASAATTCITSSGGNMGNTNTDLDGPTAGNCGNCNTMAAGMQDCSSLSNGVMWPKLDGCACALSAQCCSGMCSGFTCVP